MNSIEWEAEIEQDHLTPEIWENMTPICRICERDEGELISPCMCQGRLAYIHSNCLAQEIESRKIMEITEVNVVYNSRCSSCKFHIQFVIEEEQFELSSEGISQAVKSLDEDSAASLGMNVSLAILIFTIMTVTFIGYLKEGLEGDWSLNCKIACLEVFLACLECFLLQNIASSFPFKTRRPIPLISQTH